MTSATLENVIVAVEISPAVLAKIKAAFKTVHYFPDGIVPQEFWADAEAWYIRWLGLPKGIETVKDVPRTKLLQLSSAGANSALAHPVFQTPEARKQISVSSASGIHSLSIPPYIISHIINLYSSSQIQQYLGRSLKKWATREDLNKAIGRGTHSPHQFSFGTKTVYGKTAGLLGYGHIARETARLLKALNVKVIAANSNGTKRVDEGYIIKGTGDPDGSIPEAYYSTNDPASFKEFLSRSDILIASLPSTPATKFLLKKEHFDALPVDAIFINVGRGDLAHSEDILAALDKPEGLHGVALDVTDPEPLPDGHPFFSHPRAIITPHTSGDFEGYFDAGAELLLANAERYRKEGKFINVVDPEKGY